MKKGTVFVYLQRFIALIFCLVLINCTHRQEPKTIRICDSSGCSNRPADYVSFDSSEEGFDDELNKHIPELEKLAKKDPRAAYDLGLRFFRGDGVGQDSYQALQWMRNAAERGNLNAQKALGRFYLTGLEEMGSDPREAHKWLTIAVGRGDKEASKLLKEAAIARANEESYSRWVSRWRPVFYGYWYNGYSYNHYWRHNRWYYRY